MKALATFLKMSAPLFLLVGLLHLALGPGADVLLGAELTTRTLGDPVLDSQNRFYGVSFTVYGFLLYLCATDLPRYGPVFLVCIWVFFAGGVARLLSMAVAGVPSALVLALLATELAAPPLLALWYHRSRAHV